MKVERKVDTVLIEMQAGEADMLLALLKATGHRLYKNTGYAYPMDELRKGLAEHLRPEHPLYDTEIQAGKVVLFHNYSKGHHCNVPSCPIDGVSASNRAVSDFYRANDRTIEARD